MTVRRRNRCASVLLPAACLLLAAVAGCTGTDPRTASTSRSPTSTAPTTPMQASSTASPTVTTSGAESQAALEAYRGMWADMVDAARTADYGAPSLAAHTVDPATGQLQRTLLAFHRMGWVVKGSVIPNPTVVSMSPSDEPVQAEIVDCLDETHWLTYRADTGKVTDDEPGQHHRVDALMRRTADGWKVESFTIAAGGSC